MRRRVCWGRATGRASVRHARLPMVSAVPSFRSAFVLTCTLAAHPAPADDYFYTPSGEPVGYGEWGVIDSFRRAKPETFHVWQIYAPIKIPALPTPGSAWAPNLRVDNRLDFSDLSEVSFSWRVVETGVNGSAAASGGPHTTNNLLTLSGLPSPLAGTMQINATSARGGFLLNSWTFALSAPTPTPTPSPRPPAPTVTEQPDGSLLIEDASGSFSWSIAQSGTVTGNTSAGGQIVVGGPSLMVLPLNSDGGNQVRQSCTSSPPRPPSHA